MKSNESLGMNPDNFSDFTYNGPFNDGLRPAIETDEEIADPEHLIGVDGLIRSTKTRAKRARESAKKTLPKIPIDTHMIYAEARKAQQGADLDVCRRRVRDHQASLADDIFDGHRAELHSIKVALDDDTKQLHAAKNTVKANRDDGKQFEKDEDVEGASWSALSLVTVVMLAMLVVLLIYSSVLVVQDIYYQLDRVDNKSDAIILAPITIAAPVLLFLMAIGRGEKSRKRLSNIICVIGLIFGIVWIMTIPGAIAPKSNEGAGFSLEPQSTKIGGNGIWYLSIISQLIFEVFTASACKIGLHNIWSSHEGGGFRLTKLFKFFTRQTDTLEVAIRDIQDAAIMIIAKIKKVDARVLAAQTTGEQEFDNRLKKLRTDMLDVAEIDNRNGHINNGDQS